MLWVGVWAAPDLRNPLRDEVFGMAGRAPAARGNRRVDYTGTRAKRTDWRPPQEHADPMTDRISAEQRGEAADGIGMAWGSGAG